VRDKWLNYMGQRDCNEIGPQTGKCLPMLESPLRLDPMAAGGNRRGGTVKLTRRGRHDPSMTRFYYCSARTRHRIPDTERSRSEYTVVDSSEQMPADTKEVLHEAVHRQEALRVSDRLEATHLAFTLPGRLMREFRAIVLVLPRAVHHGRHRGAVRRGVAAQLIRDQTAGLPALSFQQLPEKTGGRPPIAPRLDKDVDDIAVLVHGTPQILLPPLDLHEHFVQIPGVAHAAPQPPRVVEPERQTPVPNSLVGDGDAALGQQVFGIAKTQADAVVEPDGVTDDLGRESIAVVVGPLAGHHPTLPAPSQLDNALRTAQRGGEVFTMEWSEVDEASEWWTIPGTKTKNQKTHRVPLTKAALTLITEARTAGSGPDGWVFAGPEDGSLQEQAKKAVSKLRHAGLAGDYTRHDLRRTVATGLQALNLPISTITHVLNQSEGGSRVTPIYARHDFSEEKKTALEVWGRHLDALSHGPHVTGGAIRWETALSLGLLKPPP
jgi:hypothetical protein